MAVPTADWQMMGYKSMLEPPRIGTTCIYLSVDGVPVIGKILEVDGDIATMSCARKWVKGGTDTIPWCIYWNGQWSYNHRFACEIE